MPAAGSGTMRGPSDATDVPMGGVWDPDSLDGADVPASQVHVDALRYVAGFEKAVPKYSGNPRTEPISSHRWIRKVMMYRRGDLRALSNQQFVSAIVGQLAGEAKQFFESEEYELPSALLADIRATFPLAVFQKMLIQRIRSGDAFAGYGVLTIGKVAIRYLAELQGHSSAVPELSEALGRLMPEQWRRHGLRPGSMSDIDFVAAIQNMQRELGAGPGVAQSAAGGR
ncbi:hypothetical protein H4R18_004939 [Coemansia javaensis]|uniref:Uncharacterized protein n=1 Tax=Coemansia javaensis TaxID=2761396 RepID=A0A9W8HAS0_9FUNG|nr:hypothetical protein H4R18_004939 [Coemansia javaensis]